MTDLLAKHSFVELGARQRAKALLDAGTFRELIDPFQRVMSPWLSRQGVVPQADDGVVIAKGSIGAKPVVIAAIEGNFQGGSLGEVGGAKIAGALELAAEDNRNGIPTCAVLLLETGGVRLQEANLGLAAIAEIHAAIVEPASVPASDRRGGRQCRLLWGHVHRGWLVQLPGGHSRSTPGLEWPASDRAGGGPGGVRLPRPAFYLEPYRWRATL